MNKSISYILFLTLILSVKADYDSCVSSCRSTHCASDSDCEYGYNSELKDIIQEYQIDECNDYAQKSAFQTEFEDSDIKAAIVLCLNTIAATFSGADLYLKEYIECDAQCYNDNYNDMDSQIESINLDHYKPIEICEVICTNDNQCNQDSQCYQDYIKNDLFYNQLSLDNNLESCFQAIALRQDSLSDEDVINEAYKKCYDEMSKIIAQNSSDYPTDLDKTYTCKSQCYQKYPIDYFDRKSNINSFSTTEDCEANYCIKDFISCQHYCFDEHCDQIGSKCLKNDTYLSYLATQECKDYFQQEIDLQKAKTKIVDQDLLDKFQACSDSWFTTYDGVEDYNNGVLLTCYDFCQTQDFKDNIDSWDGVSTKVSTKGGSEASSTLLSVGLLFVLALVVV